LGDAVNDKNASVDLFYLESNTRTLKRVS